MRIAVAGGTGVVGRYAVAAAASRGHDVTVLSRSRGVDVQRGHGLTDALAGVDVVIDTLNSRSVSRRAEQFFRDTSLQLQQAGAAAGVQHLVCLSIVGIDRVPRYGYYQAKLAHERAASSGPIPVSILRATQFHEFPAQMLSVTRKGPIALMLRIRSQPVAARTVGEHLLRLAEAQPGGTRELAGPQVHALPDLARKLLVSRGIRAKVIPISLPGTRPMREDALLATAATIIDGPAFDEWLDSTDGHVLSP